jgi:hypothetical protein
VLPTTATALFAAKSSQITYLDVFVILLVDNVYCLLNITKDEVAVAVISLTG